MRKIKSYIIGMAAAAAIGSAATGCQDDFDSYTPQEPVATLKPNKTILDIKTKYWDDATNYIDTIGVENGVSDDEDYIISGRVVSSDEAGNVFKSLVIQDETAAIALSINSYNLYLKYRMGQEVVINLKGMYIGKYNGLQQLGMPEWYESGQVWEASFMAPEFFQSHVELNGFPNSADIDTLEINSFDQLPTNPDGLRKYQSRLVKFNNVYFQNGGKEKFSEYHSSGVNQNIVDVNGSTLPVRTSGYSNFWNNTLPAEHGDVVCILSYYGNTGWQLILNDYQGLMNFGNPTEAPGTESKPYSVEEAIAAIKSGKTASGWVEGYIVGAVAPEVTEVKTNDDIEWSDEVVLSNTLVIGATPDTKDISQALVIELPQGSVLRQYGNLADNPGNYKKKILVKGQLGTYMDTFGVIGNTGKKGEFKIEGVEISDGSAPDGVGTEASPYNVAQVIAKNPQGNKDNPDEKNVWVTGYIVGWADLSTVFVINDETAKFSTPASIATNILIAATPDVTDFRECLGIQLPSGSVRSALNLVDNPGNLGCGVKLCGNISKYSGVAGITQTSKCQLIGGGGDTPNPPSGNTLYCQPFNSEDMGGFIINDVKLSDGLKYVWKVDTQYGYIKGSAYANNQSNAAESWLISPVFDLKDATDVSFSFEQANNKYASASDIPTQATVWVSSDGGDWQQVKISNYGNNTSWTFVNSGDISLKAYEGKKVSIGFRYTGTSTSSGAWEIKNFAIKGSGSVTTSTAVIPGGGNTPEIPDTPDKPDTPDIPVTGNSADFDTFNDGKAAPSKYDTYRTATGWVAEFSVILQGGTEATNFISVDSKVLFPVIDGTQARPGKLISPTISGGVKTLSFKYGFPYNENVAGFTVNILQNGKVVASNTVVADPATKGKVYEYSHDFNVSGDCEIEIVNDLVSQTASGNKDRIAIWNISWSN